MKKIIKYLKKYFLVAAAITITITSIIRLFQGHYILGSIKLVFGIFLLIIYTDFQNID